MMILYIFFLPTSIALKLGFLWNTFWLCYNRVQVAKQDHRDKRALAYVHVANIYAQQLKPTDADEMLRDVAEITLLGDGSIPSWKDHNVIRDYVFTDKKTVWIQYPSYDWFNILWGMQNQFTKISLAIQNLNSGLSVLSQPTNNQSRQHPSLNLTGNPLRWSKLMVWTSRTST